MTHVIITLRFHEDVSSPTVQDQPKSLVAVLRRRAYYSDCCEGASCNQSASSARRHSQLIQTSDKIRFLPIAIVTYGVEGMPPSRIRYG